MRVTRPIRMLFIIVFALLSAAIVFSLAINKGIATGQSAYSSQSEVMQDFVRFTNELRKSKNLPTLEQSEQLEQSAIAKLEDMQQQQYWGHYTPNGQSFSRFIWQYDVDAQLVGENLARCFDSHEAAFNALVQSPTHYKVLTGDFSNIGVASQKTSSGCESIVMHVSRS